MENLFFLMTKRATLISQISNWYPKERRAMCVSGDGGFLREEQKKLLKVLTANIFLNLMKAVNPKI